MLLAASFAGLLIPLALAVVLAVRLRRWSAANRAQLETFAWRLGLRGTLDSPFSLGGAYDGLPLYVTEETVRGERGTRVFTRVRLLIGDPAGYRVAPGGAASAFAVRRDEGFAFELAAGLLEVPSGSPTFDGAYRCFVAPGTTSPWSDPAMHVGLMSMPGDLVRVERGPAECAATFVGSTTSPDVLERAVVILASLASLQGAQRHHAQLAAPLDSAPSRESVRLRWAAIRLAVVVIVGMLVGVPLMFFDPVTDLTATIACDEGETIGMVGNGRGASARCIGKHGLGESVNGVLFLVGLDLGLAGVLAVFSVVEVAARLGSRRKNASRPAAR